eukprot:1170054-Alexandrium_andersonii.AAC.1
MGSLGTWKRGILESWKLGIFEAWDLEVGIHDGGAIRPPPNVQNCVRQFLFPPTTASCMCMRGAFRRLSALSACG